MHSPVHDPESRWVCATASDEATVREALDQSMRMLDIQHEVGHAPFDHVDVWPLRQWLKAKGYRTIWDYMERASDAEFRDIGRLHVDAGGAR